MLPAESQDSIARYRQCVRGSTVVADRVLYSQSGCEDECSSSFQLSVISRQMSAVSFLMSGNGMSGCPLLVECGYQTKKSSDVFGFRLALYVLLSNVRTDSRSGGKADERWVTLAVVRGATESRIRLSTISAGVSNASTRPTSVESQQPIQRGFSLRAL